MPLSESERERSRTRVDNIMAGYTRTFNDMIHLDQQAKAAGELVNRVISHPHADGKAWYRIVEVRPKTVKLEVVTGIGDDWVLPAWGPNPTLSIRVVREFLARRDNFDRIFGRE